MGNRSRYVAMGAMAAGAAVVASRRRRRRLAGAGDEDPRIHACGHRHLQEPEAPAGPPMPLRERPWTKNVHGMRRPFSAD